MRERAGRENRSNENAIRFMESFDLQEWTRIGAMNLIE
jgi:hypothetical protein